MEKVAVDTEATACPNSSTGQHPQRTAEEVSTSAKAAGLVGCVGPVQLLHFSPHLHSEDVRLLEVHGPVLSALTRGESVVIRGSPNDDAVLCTRDKTFELRVADTSNTLLLAPSLSTPTPGSTDAGTSDESSLIPCEITACVNSYLELRPCQPRLERLKSLLMECPFQGLEYEPELVGEESQGVELDSAPLDSHDLEDEGPGRGKLREAKKRTPRKYTFEDLLNLVQASEDELYQALDKLQACPIQGYWRCLGLDYRDRVLQNVLTLLDEQGWSYHQVPLKAACQLLSELEPSFAIEHCISCYGDKLEEDMDTEDEAEVYYSMSELKVCQFYAELLLRPADRFNYHEFLNSWQESVPEGMQTSLDQLRGLALTDLSGAAPAIWFYSAADLPQDPSERFLSLFRVREKWSFEEIEPYIRDLESPSVSLNAMLMKYARVSNDGKGTKMYSSKRSVV